MIGRFLLCAFILMPTVFADYAVINEVFYNPLGADAGKEFVELYNPGESSLSLDGYVLESGNGANPNDWTVEWASGQGDRILAKGYFLIAESNYSTADFLADLDLQNGPDAVRLRKNSTIIDLVGYGSHQYPEYFEKTPAKLAREGFSLARSDGIDSGNNSFDFSESLPSPQSSREDSIAISVKVIEPSVGAISASIMDDDPLAFGFQVAPFPGVAKVVPVAVNLVFSSVNATVRLTLFNRRYNLIRVNQTFFSGSVNISFSDPPGNHSVNISVVDGLKRGVALLDFQIMPLTAFLIDSSSISFSAEPNSVVQVVGDLDISTIDRSTVKNIGNIPIDFGLRATVLSSGAYAILPENIEMAFSSAFSSDKVTLSTSTQFVSLSLPSASSKEVSYKIFVPELIAPSTYTGSIFMTARPSE
jgi:hypothetical protein